MKFCASTTTGVGLPHLLALHVMAAFPAHTGIRSTLPRIGVGRLNQGVISPFRGERARIYRNESLAASAPTTPDTFPVDSAGLPPGFFPDICQSAQRVCTERKPDRCTWQS